MENHHTNGNGTNGAEDPNLIQYESSLYKFKGNGFFFISCFLIIKLKMVIL